MKVVGYLRVSTAGQADEGYGLDVQRQAVREWAKASRHRLVSILADEGVSGAKELDDRPALADALAMVRSGQADAIVVARLDRLARDLVVQETVLAETRRYGGRVFSSVPAESEYLTDDPGDPSRKLIRQVLGAVAEYERQLIVMRLRTGRAAKARQGGFAYGAPSYGYEAKDGTLAPIEGEQATLHRIASLRRSGASLRAICAALEHEGHRTKRGGTRWQPAVVARLLSRMERAA